MVESIKYILMKVLMIFKNIVKRHNRLCSCLDHIAKSAPMILLSEELIKIKF